MDAADRLRRAVDRLVYLPSLREGGAAGPSPALAAVAAAAAVSRERRRQGGGAGSGSSAAAFLPLPPRPWDRADLFRRAATFKPSTWFAKDPVTAGPLVAASRGWTNVGLDLLRCEFCGERLAATASTETGGNHGNEESESENHKNSFRSRLVSCHAAACPWHTGPACDLDSLAQFPPLTREGMESDFKARERAALALDFLPPLSRASYEVPAIFAPSRLEALLQHGPRPADGDDEATEEAPEPPVLLLLAADEEKTNPAATALVAPHGSRLHLRMCRLIALYGWKAEIVAPAVAKRAAARVAEAERGRIRAAVEEAAAKKRKAAAAAAPAGKKAKKRPASSSKKANKADSSDEESDESEESEEEADSDDSDAPIAKKKKPVAASAAKKATPAAAASGKKKPAAASTASKKRDVAFDDSDDSEDDDVPLRQRAAAAGAKK